MACLNPLGEKKQELLVSDVAPSFLEWQASVREGGQVNHERVLASQGNCKFSEGEI